MPVNQQDELIPHFLSFLVLALFDKDLHSRPNRTKKGVVLIDDGAIQQNDRQEIETRKLKFTRNPFTIPPQSTTSQSSAYQDP